MRFAAYQRCRSHTPWLPIEVPSQSDPDVTYTVMLCPFGNVDENICECPGYEFRGECSHQVIAAQLWCGWSEIGIGAERQTRAQAAMMVCPACGDDTEWVFRPVKEGDTAVS